MKRSTLTKRKRRSIQPSLLSLCWSKTQLLLLNSYAKEDVHKILFKMYKFNEFLVIYFGLINVHFPFQGLINQIFWNVVEKLYQYCLVKFLFVI